MHKLLEKKDIRGTCWVEVNVTGDSETYEFWDESSRFASLDAMYEVYDLFSMTVERFDLYRPILLSAESVTQVSGLLDGFASSNPSHAASGFAVELSWFLAESAKEGRSIWMLGV